MSLTFPVDYRESVLKHLPTSYWRLGEALGASIVVDEVANYGGTYNSSPVLEEPSLLVGDDNTCMQLDGISGSVTISPSALISGEYTFVTSIKPTSGDLGCFVVLHNGTGFRLYRYLGNLQSYSNSGGWDNTGFALTPDTIYHIVVTATATEARFYVNGVHVHTRTLNVIDCALAYIGIATNQQRFDGHIDDTAIIPGLLTDLEIETLYNASQGIFPTSAFDIVIDHTKVDSDLYDFPLLVNLGASSGIDAFDSSEIFNSINAYEVAILNLQPLGYWRLGEIIGSTVAVDEIGVNDGTYLNTPTLGQNSLLTNDADTSVLFNGGAGEYVDVPSLTHVIDNTKPFTVTFLVNQTILSDDGYFTLPSETHDGLLVWAGTGGYGDLAIGNNTADWESSHCEYTPVIDTTYHAVIVYDGVDPLALSSFKFYINGELKTTIASGNYSITPCDNFEIGNISYIAGREAKAVMDEVAVWDNKALTQIEITELYDISQGQAQAGLNTFHAVYINPADNDNDYHTEVIRINPLVYWRLDELAGDSVFDNVGNVDGTHVGSPTLNVPGLLVTDSNSAVAYAANQYSVYATPITTAKSISFIFSVLDAATSYQPIFGQYKDDNNRIHFHAVTDVANGFVGAMVGLVGGTLHTAYTDTILYGNGVIHHCVITYDGVDSLIYIDGVLQVEKFVGINFFMSDHINQSVGAYHWQGTYYSTGTRTVDEVSLFDVHLSQNQVSRLYNRSINTLPADSTITSRECKVEIDRWDQANQQSQLWIKVPYVSKDVDTVLNLSFDPDNIDNSSNIGRTGETPAKAVWSEYDAVYHLSKDGTDSTVNALNGALVNMDSSNVVDFGIGKGLRFNGVDEHITLTSDDLARIYNISMLMNLDNVIGQQALFDGANGGWYMNGDKLSYNLTSDGINSLLALTPYDVVLQDASGTGSTFIDGVFVDSITPDAVNLIIDRIATETSIPANWFAGKLKEIRFSKTIKTPGWIATNYHSTQDNLTRYSTAESYILAKNILGSITENVAVVDWLIRAYRLDTGELTAQLQTIAGAFKLPVPVGNWVPTMVTVSPEQGIRWSHITAQFVDDLIFPTDPETTPYYFKCTVSGTGVDGVTDSVEPTWPTVPGQTVVDGTVTWEVVERMIQPITHSPMIPK